MMASSLGQFSLSKFAVFTLPILVWACSSAPATQGSNDSDGSGATGGTVQTDAGDSGVGGAASGGAVGSGGDSGSTGGTGGTPGTGGQGGETGEGGARPWPTAECQALAADLLGQMTLQEKAAQMVMAPNPEPQLVTQYAPGAVFSEGGASPLDDPSPAKWAEGTDAYKAAAAASRLKIPILYGADVVHGNNVATGTVIFPHNIGLGCANNPTLTQEIGRITALEAAAAGISWVFGPMISVSFDDRWGRAYESFSEDPTLTGSLSEAMVLGLQGAQGIGTGTPGVIGCSKHWAGDGQATYGTSSKAEGLVDRGDVQIDEAAMRELGIAPYLPALEAGLGSIMVSDARWNNQSMTSNHRLVTEILKEEIGFAGFVATDYNAASDGPGIPATINAGVDMLMEFGDWIGAMNEIVSSVDSSAIALERVDDAVTRILTVKCEAGLFEEQRDPELLSKIGSAEHRGVARQAVRESLVLLKNDNDALPLAKGSTVWVGGSGANNLDNQCGGWTISWQGDGSQTQGTTILQAIEKVATVTPNMAEADAVIVALSEAPYAEFMGDVESVDTLPASDFALLSDAENSGKKVVAIVVSGRPVIIESHLSQADAWLAAWLPGTEGDGVADVLFGDYAPVGKLSHSWPRTDAQVTVNKGDPGYDPLFEFGHGLTY